MSVLCWGIWKCSAQWFTLVQLCIRSWLRWVIFFRDKDFRVSLLYSYKVKFEMYILGRNHLRNFINSIDIHLDLPPIYNYVLKII